MKTQNSHRRRTTEIALLSFVLLFVFSRARAQASQDGPSFSDTAQYLTTFLANHGCTSWQVDSPSAKIGSTSVQACVSLTTTDSCVMEFSERRTATDNRGSYNSPQPIRRVDLALLDPSSVKAGSFQHIDQFQIDNGFGVVAQLQAGGRGLVLPVDSAENVTHLINALSHAITLCGGKKTAF